MLEIVVICMCAA